MRRCSALGNGASTLLLRPLYRLPPRCLEPQPSSSPPNRSAFWTSPALYQGAERLQLTMPGNRMRGDRWGGGGSMELEVDFLGWDIDREWLLLLSEPLFPVVPQRHRARRLLSCF